MLFITDKLNTALPEKTLEKLFWLRNIAIFGQVITILSVKYLLDIPLLDNEMWVVITLLAIFNVFVFFRIQGEIQTIEWEVASHILLDTTAFATLLYFSGGASNPFISLLLVPIALSAVFLHLYYALFITLSCISFYSLLMIWSTPLPPVHQRFGGDFNLHIFGMWISFILSALILITFVSLLVRITKRHEKDLASIREENLINQHLISLGTLSAGVAHEFATPFSNIKMIADELLAEPNNIELIKENALLLKEQTEACQLQLKKLFRNIKSDKQQISPQSLRQFLQASIDRWLAMRSEISLQSQLDIPKELLITPDETLSQTFINVLENAADASLDNNAASVSLIATIKNKMLIIKIRDKGKGIFLDETSQKQYDPFSTKAEGHGVGLVLSHATLSRLGGSLKLSTQDNKGTCASIHLPLSAITDITEEVTD
ncbi:MAG TPA: GHKL domain-containing protein [Leucothrix mucor]|nr:GHKL domain-containing protein [Leucothrix mucor]